MKKSVWLVGAVLLSCLAGHDGAEAAENPAVQSTDRILIDGVAAYVNTHVITIGDVMVVVEPVRRQLQSLYDRDELRRRLRKVYGDALNSLIERRLILDAYESQGMRIPEWVVDKRIHAIIHDMFDDDRATLMTALAKDRLTFDEWRDEMVNNMIATSMRELNVEQNVRISPITTREFFDRNAEKYVIPGKIRLRMIVLKKNSIGGGPALKRRQAEDVRKRAVTGEDFAILAKNLSEGSKSADGGDWGWIEPKILRPELAKAVADLKPTDISEVIETDDEFYIIKIEGRWNESIADFQSIQPKIERDLQQKQAMLLYKDWTDRLRKKAYVNVLDVELF